MEHEVFVPVPAERLREVLDDPARVARAVPGLQQDAGAEPVAGRLKIRVGSHSVTYRGAVRVSRRDDGAYGVEGGAEESRGSGSVTLALRIALREAEDGCTVVFDGTASADGRIRDLPADAVEGAVTRLLNRFAEHLAEAAPETATPLATQDFEPRATTNHETTPDADDAPAPPPPPSPPAADADAAGADAAGADAAGKPAASGPAEGGDAPGAGLTEEAPSPSPAPGPRGDTAASSRGPSDDDEVAEAAHARRTMIGRSAEEVDHAPPRGRYAPVPAPQTVTTPAPLRWAAPAAALAVASAIVAVRALRRRR
ncbi:SRPBCC domain-containing protein [Streptomyces sp. NPDC006624]|uniref:SRPBCC family protein n=1 Tax=Streptomyces sp. NPDC006624 TaxID=3154892 RepID=UPI0033BFA28C